MPTVSYEPTVTVIIPAYNEEKVIGRCLKALQDLTYPTEQIQILVLDNGSSDSTVQIARESRALVHIIAGIPVGALRNAGVQLAKGEVLAFLDADCLPEKEWLQNAVASLQREHCITGAPYRNPSPAHWIEHAWHATERAGRYETTHINAGNLICWRQDFLRIGGFDTNLITGEDYEFAQRAKHSVRVVADESIAVVHLGNPQTLRAFTRREIWHGLGALGSLRHDLRDKPFWGTVAFGLGLCTVAGGLLSLAIGRGSYPLVIGATLIAAVVGGSTLFRIRRRAIDGVTALQLSLLFSAFYVGRLVALARISLGWKNYRREK